MSTQLASLNARFVQGQPSSNASQAGVLIRMFDRDDTESDEPWLPCRAPRWCASLGNRMITSLVSMRLPHVSKEGSLGMVLSAAHSRIRCSFFADFGTMRRVCAADSPPGCEPGCCDSYGRPNWCGDPASEGKEIYGCAFRPSDLNAMLRHHQLQAKPVANNVVIDPTSWVLDSHTTAPVAIEAFFFIRDPEAEAEHAFRESFRPSPGRSLASKTPRDGEAKAREIHARFLRRYPSTPVPLLRLELNQLERPFTRVA